MANEEKSEAAAAAHAVDKQEHTSRKYKNVKKSFKRIFKTKKKKNIATECSVPVEASMDSISEISVDTTSLTQSGTGCDDDGVEFTDSISEISADITSLKLIPTGSDNVEEPSLDAQIGTDSLTKGLISAVSHGDINAVNRNLQEGANAKVVLPQYKTMHQVNLICLAAVEGKANIISSLHSAGANIHHYVSDGRQAVHIAASLGYSDVLGKLHDLGADMDAFSTNGRKAVHYAASHGYSHVLYKLKNLGADMEAISTYGQRTALHYATLSDHHHCIQKLCEMNICLEVADIDHRTPLMMAAWKNQLDCVQTLVSNGADLTAKDLCGDTPLLFARKSNSGPIIDWLVDYEFQNEDNPDKTYTNKKALLVFLNYIKFPKGDRKGADKDRECLLHFPRHFEV